MRFFVAVCLAAVCTALAWAASGSTPAVTSPVLRIFLKDGTPLVCDGEYTRTADRVVFAVPLGSTASPDALHVITLPADAIDRDKTTSYTSSAGSLLLLDRSRSNITAYFQRPGSR